VLLAGAVLSGAVLLAGGTSRAMLASARLSCIWYYGMLLYYLYTYLHLIGVFRDEAGLASFY